LYFTLGGLLVLAAVLIGISGIPRFKNGSGLDGVIGGIGWFGGLLCILAFLVLGGMAVVRARRGRREPASA
jgi:TM2 domain-containing membrane protein YozV